MVVELNRKKSKKISSKDHKQALLAMITMHSREGNVKNHPCLYNKWCQVRESIISPSLLRIVLVRY